MTSYGRYVYGVTTCADRSAVDAKHFVECREGCHGGSDDGRLLNVGRLEILRTARAGQLAERSAVAGVGRLPDLARGG